MKVLLAAILTLSSLYSKSQSEDWMDEYKANFKENWVGKELPKQVLTDVSGETFNYSDMRDEVIVFNFWFIGCKPCIREMPMLNKIVEEFKDNNVTFLAPSFESRSKIKSFLKKRSFNYNLISDEPFTKQAIGVKVFPTHLVVKNGVVLNVIIGYESNTETELSEMISAALE